MPLLGNGLYSIWFFMHVCGDKRRRILSSIYSIYISLEICNDSY